MQVARYNRTYKNLVFYSIKKSRVMYIVCVPQLRPNPSCIHSPQQCTYGPSLICNQCKKVLLKHIVCVCVCGLRQSQSRPRSIHENDRDMDRTIRQQKAPQWGLLVLVDEAAGVGMYCSHGLRSLLDSADLNACTEYMHTS